MGKKRAKSKRLQKLIASGKTPFNCSYCPRVFASERDKGHHEKDAHGPGKKETPAMARHHQHQMQQQHQQQPGGNVVTRLFTRNKDKEEVLVIDFVTLHTGVPCSHPGCVKASIPLTGLCIDHDLLCQAILRSRALKAIADAKAEADKKTIVVPPNPRFDHNMRPGAGAEMMDYGGDEYNTAWDRFN